MLNIKYLLELMEEKGIPNMSALSRLTKIPYSTLNYMLTGHDMHVGTFVELSKFFNIPVDYMINKPYSVVVYTEDSEKVLSTTSLIEALVSNGL
ncbi:MAG TPA: hypothetical protein DCY94_05495 [Firmicutes bacterium]|nr:hypothetical protein [Bacillota bacterium]